MIWKMKAVSSPTFFLIFLSSPVWAINRYYYIGIKETTWDYAPTGRNMLNGKKFSEDQEFQSQVYLQRGSDRIGSVYKKALYYQYTDDTFQTMIEKPSWLGYLGPIIMAETGDLVHVHVKNDASRPYTWHPHGVSYAKAREGALYPDNTTGLQKEDDHVEPGTEYTYRWLVDEKQGPGPSDSDCVTRMYHSHLDTVKDVASGLIGPILTCKTGTLVGNTDKKINKKLFVMLFYTDDENNSWYLNDNVITYAEPSKINTSDPDFKESNKMYAINGYTYGNLPDLVMCAEDQVMWHLMSIGGAVNEHSIYFHGQTVISRNHRRDTLTVFPASMEEALMVAQSPGEWMLSCEIHESMQAFFTVEDCQNTTTDVTGEKTVHYYIAAEEILWNYGPSGIDFFTGDSLTAPGRPYISGSVYRATYPSSFFWNENREDIMSDFSFSCESQPHFEKGPTRIGGTYMKIAYREYTDASFETCVTREGHLGIIGPVIKAEVGQTIEVTFYNNASVPLSIQPHGLRYTKSNEGSFYKTPKEDIPARSTHVNPSTTFVYTWHVPVDVGPTSTDPNCLTWLYYSSVEKDKDTNSGLVGPLLVCRSGSLGEDGKQKEVDREFYLLATIFDENKSHLLDENIRMFTTQPENIDKEDPDFQNSNRMYSINGYMYGNLPGLDMCVGDNVSWHVLSVGSASDLHGIYFSGHTFVSLGSRMDTVTVFPHISQTLSMVPDSTGIFDVVCMTIEHFQGGMKHKYLVSQCLEPNLDETDFQEVKTIYIAAEEITWDYSPNRKWERELHRLQGKENQTNIFVDKTGTLLGSKYKKVLYRQYDDITFTNQTERSEEEKHLDILGPLILLYPGDVIQVVFKNNAPRPYSIHAHGVRTNSSTVVPTQPGEIQTYTWQIPERSGPTSGNFECIPWIYYSTVDYVKDINSGLIGPLVVCRKNANPNIIHRVLLFMIFDENQSWYIDENINTYSSDPNNIDREDRTFRISNQIHALNGRIFGNNQGLTVHVGDEVNWYLISLGSENDLHTAHFHGHSFQYMDSGLYHSDVYDLPPGTYRTVKMFPRTVGTWLFHCHVAEHIQAGMESTYTVVERDAQIAP